jgi:GNAT superfamily N-acetyltransferase
MTDVVGVVDHIDDDTIVVISERGDRVEVTRDQVVAMKEIAPRPIRTSEIRALEHAAADGWAGLEQEWIGGWLLKAGSGFTGRANSAVPLGAEADDRSLDAIRAWYDARGLTTRLLLPDRLGAVPPGWQSLLDVVVMAADVTEFVSPPSPPVVVSSSPDPQWFDAYHYRGQRTPDAAGPVLEAVRQGVVGFLRLGDDTTTLAIARAAVTTAPDDRRWVGLSAVEVAAAHRRRGLGTLVCAAAIEWGRERGATHAYLQVESSNESAIAMYRAMGFVPHHRYRYAVPLE